MREVAWMGYDNANAKQDVIQEDQKSMRDPRAGRRVERGFQSYDVGGGVTRRARMQNDMYNE
jgi:hypothetical protein